MVVTSQSHRDVTSSPVCLLLFLKYFLRIIYAHFESSFSAAVGGFEQCPLDRFVLNDLCEEISHETGLRSYYMLRQGKYSS